MSKKALTIKITILKLIITRGASAEHSATFTPVKRIEVYKLKIIIPILFEDSLNSARGVQSRLAARNSDE